jgi:hypothetical protein
VPAAPNHYCFALAALQSLAQSPDPGETCRAALFRPSLVLVGTQGSDPFFFLGKVPWRRRADVDRPAGGFGTFIHAADPSDVFPRIAARAASLDGDERKTAAAYAFGLLLHYLLDRAVHPYVFYRSGFDADGGLSGRHAVDHAMFETMLAERDGRSAPAAATAPTRMFAAAPEDLAAADRFLAESFPGELEPGRFAEAWADMRTVARILWDPAGIKRRLFKLLGGQNSKAYAMIRPRPSDDGIDYLNEGKAQWRDPVSGAESAASFRELAGTAAAEIPAAAAAMDRALAGQNADWERLFRGVNHDGVRTGELKRFQDPVYGRAY